MHRIFKRLRSEIIELSQRSRNLMFHYPTKYLCYVTLKLRLLFYSLISVAFFLTTSILFSLWQTISQAEVSTSLNSSCVLA